MTGSWFRFIKLLLFSELIQNAFWDIRVVPVKESLNKFPFKRRSYIRYN